MTGPITKRMGLWGATQVGKTSLLATALYKTNSRLASLTARPAAESIASKLLDVYRRLMTNQLVLGTAGSVDLQLTTSGGIDVDLVDISGIAATELHDPMSQQMLRTLDAVLFFIEYAPQAQQGEQIVTIEGALRELGDRPSALAVTKCEAHIPAGSTIWSVPAGWLEQTPMWLHHQHTLRRFEGRAWPTSAFGYHRETGLPAMILGEMGQLLPYNIQPIGVADTLEWLLAEMDCL